MHALLTGRGQLGHGDQQRTRAVRPGQTRQCSLHHLYCTSSVHIGHIHIQSAQHCHGFLYRIGNIVQFQIQKDLVSTLFQLPYNGRTLCVIQLHTDLHKRLFLCEFVQERKGCLCACKIASHDHIFTHFLPLLSHHLIYQSPGLRTQSADPQ